MSNIPPVESIAEILNGLLLRVAALEASIGKKK